MPILPNPKHEAAAQAFAAGKTQQQAYTEAGFTYKPANASRFFKRADVRARMQEIIAERIDVERKSSELAVRKVGLTKEWVIERLMWNAERCLRGTPVRDANGKHTGEFTGKVDAAGANRALELLGKHLGMFIDRHEIGEPGQFARMTDEELDAALVAQAKALGFPQEGIDFLLSKRIDPIKH
ncbi:MULTISPECIES: hypothetical protein [unclassified Bradyrhizobium]|uniref:hypothetical protein n=1 Tax=unclassified Bradyrhizobium TaxID=2631580 RepID=UPI002916E2EB|nr:MULTISPECIES: hypothetical protein [unclassified Bradyrhizobium]